jgi:hypothetical protein
MPGQAQLSTTRRKRPVAAALESGGDLFGSGDQTLRQRELTRGIIPEVMAVMRCGDGRISDMCL